ncbi:hypothetical protein EDM68_01390 [Candidatus Uhrbacteria bacterium]|nr:MAG: hypothetical protein EDM68_01390 [Candidatus Uhrbacteria bacterium]
MPEAFAMPAPEDKQTLIAAHAERRKAHPPGNLFGMYVGVAVCTILVLVGWAIALPKMLGSTPDKADGAIDAVVQHGSAFTQSFSGDKPFEETAKLIEDMKRQQESAKNN